MKIKLIAVILLILFIPTVSVEAIKFIRYKGSDYIVAIPDNQGSNRIATISIDLTDNNRVNTIEVLNSDTSKYDVIIGISSNVSFSPNAGVDRLELSGNYLAVTYRDKDLDKSIIAIYDISDENPILLMSREVWPLSSMGKFSLYGHYLVFQGFKNDNDIFSTAKITYIDLRNNLDEIKKINGDDDYAYLNPIVYRGVVFCERNGYLYSYNIETGEQKDIAKLEGTKSKNIRVSDNYIAYRSFSNNKKNIVIYDRRKKENRVIYDYSENENIDWMDLNNGYLTFAERASSGFSRNEIYLFDLKSDFLHYLKSDKFFLGYPALSDELFIWTSKRDGAYEIYYSELNDMENNNDFINLANIFNISQGKAEKYKGKILLQVGQNGEAWYVYGLSSYRPVYFSKAWGKNRDKNLIVYLGRPDDAFALMRQTGIGISNHDLEKIPVANKHCPSYMPDCDQPTNYDTMFAAKHKGKIFLQTEENGEAWYINPDDEKRYFLGHPSNAFYIMKNLGLGVSNNDLKSFFE